MDTNSKEYALKNIYNDFIKELEIVNRFYQITIGSYGLFSIMSESPVEFKKDKFKDQIAGNRKRSYSPADSEVETPTLLCEWVSMEEYADREHASMDKVVLEGNAGELGEIVEDNGIKYIIWPSQYQFSDEKPKFRKKLYEVPVKQKMGVEIDISSQEDLLGLLKFQYGNPDKATCEATKVLNRETFLLYWSAFEQYIKQIAIALFEIYPEEVFKNKKYGKENMSYMEIYVKSNHFTDIQELRLHILDMIIGSIGQANRDSISKTIQFIKDCFIGAKDNPYETWYVFEGEKIRTSYVAVEEIRHIRNALVHENGMVWADEIRENSLVNETEGGHVVVTKEMLEKVMMIIKSVGYNLYNCVLRKMK